MLAVLVALLGAISLGSIASASTLYQTVLPNGLEVLVVPDRRAPSVVHMLYYDVGSLDEPLGQSGLAHLFEHMMFKGTEELPAGAFSQRVAALGGRDNAFTSYDTTAYFQQIPPQALSEVMRLEADRMQNLRFDEGEFLKERQVVLEERALRVDDVPLAKGHELLQALLFMAHPYRRPIIGWRHELERLTLADLQNWYQRWYAPNNARLIIVGDVEAEEVLRQAAAIYGQIPPREGIPPLSERIYLDDAPAAMLPRSAELRDQVRAPTVLLGWQIPAFRSATDREVAALVALVTLLDGYEGARLPKALVKKQDAIAQRVSAEIDVFGRGPGRILIEVEARNPATAVATLVEAIFGEIERIAREGIHEAELQRVVRHYRAQQIFARDSLMGQAMRIGMLRAAALPYNADEQLVALVAEITPAEVQESARKWLRREQAARLDILPLSQAR